MKASPTVQAGPEEGHGQESTYRLGWGTHRNEARKMLCAMPGLGVGLWSADSHF